MPQVSLISAAIDSNKKDFFAASVESGHFNKSVLKTQTPTRQASVKELSLREE